jgi:3-phosphoinositide dependent protein kinase-1
LKITDFGTSKFLDPKAEASSDGKDARNSFVGTAEYVSPEVLNDERAGPPADIWALGCILFQMIVGKPPFRGESEYLTFRKITNRELHFPGEFDPAAQALVDRLLMLDPSQRPGSTAQGYEELKLDPFFGAVHWKTLLQTTPPHVEDEYPELGAAAKDEDSDFESEGLALAADYQANSQTDPKSPADSINKRKQEEPVGEAKNVEAPKAQAEERYAQFRSVLLESERVVYASSVSIRSGLFKAKRDLVLTSLPRFLFLDKLVAKMEVDCSGALVAQLKDKQTFVLHTPKQKHTVTAADAEEWIAQINALKAKSV